MVTVELTTETPEEMITLLRGLNLEGTKNEPVYKVQKPTILRPEDVQTEEGLGEAPKKEIDESPVEKLKETCRSFAEYLEDSVNSRYIHDFEDHCYHITMAAETLRKAATVIDRLETFLLNTSFESACAAIDVGHTIEGGSKCEC